MERTANNKLAVELTNKGVSLNGKHAVLLCGSLFYFRLPRSVWKDRIAKLKRAGYNCVDVYFPWNYHERADGSFDFTGERDVRYFLEELEKAGLYVIARPGPYICSEWNGGSLPARILESGMPIRCADPSFIAEVKKWYAAILPQIAPFRYAGGGGNIILLQLENELDFFDCPDPNAYISELVKLAETYCPGIPYFCCAGQYGIERAGGCTPGVEATLNCYPSSSDNTFDAELWAYAHGFAQQNKPLLVSETNRDHFLLRRELSCGAKLLGAYNQAAGVNFAYNQAVNNWGAPDAFLGTMYDFGSMIDSAGNYREEAKQALLFAAFLRTLDEAMGAATPAKETVVPQNGTFTSTAGGLRVLDLCGGGAAVCVPNFGKTAGEIAFVYNGHAVQAEVKGMQAPFFLFDYPLHGYGIHAVLTQCDGELIAASAEELVFNDAREVRINWGEGERTFTRNSTFNGLKIRFVRGDEALRTAARTVGAGEVPAVKVYTKESLTAWQAAVAPAFVPVENPQGTTFGELGVTEGELRYMVRIPAGKALFIEGPCDMLRVDTQGARGETQHASGRNVTVPPAENGEYTVTVGKWGHSNFDDSQSPSLRISCKKGVRSFGCIEQDEQIGRCDFKLLDSFDAERIEPDKGLPIRIGTDKWNSTRKPVICSYSLPVTRRCARLILQTAERAETAVYIDGKRAGVSEFGTFELTPYVSEGETKTLTVVYRKHVWTQDCGEAHLLHISPVQPLRTEALRANEVLTVHGGGEAVSLPISLCEPIALYAEIPLTRECRLRLTGKNVLVTGVMDGRVLGRAIAGWTHAPALHGGNTDELYLCKDWSGKLYLYIEPLGHDACVSGAELLYVC